jgi:HPt (histidine-containing phosphotransfer) domain-containing protein
MQWPGNQHAAFALGRQPVLSITNGVHYTMHSKHDIARNVNFVALEKHAATLSQLILDLANTSQKIERQATPVFDAEETNEWSRLLTRLREQVIQSPANAAGQKKIDDVLFELKRFQGRALQQRAAREAVLLPAASIAFFMAHPAAVEYQNLLNTARNAEQAGDRAKAREAYQKLLKFIEEEYRQDDQTAAEFRSHVK